MDDQEHARLHCALDRILDVVEHPPEDDEGKFLSQRTLDALQDLNAILTGAEPIIRKLWVTVPEDAESASAIRWPVIRVLVTFSKLLPPEVWNTFVVDLIGLEDGQSSGVFEPKRPLKRKGWQARSILSQSMGSLLLWWAETIEAGGKPIGINGAAEHSCLVLGVDDRRTPFRWMATIEEDTKTAIKIAAEQWRAGVRDCDALSGHEFAFIGPVLGQDEEAVKLLYQFLHLHATGKIQRIMKLRRASSSSTPA